MAQESHARKLHQGHLFKKGQINKSWKSRWFVLYNSRRLAYFEQSNSSSPIKEIDLAEVQSINILPSTSEDLGKRQKGHKLQNSGQMNTIEYNHGHQYDLGSDSILRSESISVAPASSTDRDFCFELITAKRTYLLSARTAEELSAWRGQLEKSVFGGRLHQGWLIKRGAYRKSWRRRWFVIYDTQEMRYYDDQSRQEPKGLIKLHSVLLMCPGDKDQYNQPYTIQLMTPDRNWVLATQSQKERDEWFGRLEETIHGAKRLITSHEGYLWKRGQVVKAWKKRYFALSKGWLFYFEEQFHCNKFKSIAFFSEAFFNQAFRLYVKGSIPLHQTTIQKVDATSKDFKDYRQSTKMSKIDTQITNSKSVFNDEDNAELSEREFVFKILTEKREFQFATETRAELEKWFRAFHSTHSGNGRGGDDEESEYTETEQTQTRTEVGVDGDEEVYDEDLMVGINRNATDLMDSDGDEGTPEPTQSGIAVEKLIVDAEVKVGVKVDEEEDEKKSEEMETMSSPKAKDRSGSKTPLMDIVDPKGTGKWVDIEAEAVEKKQSSVLKEEFPETQMKGQAQTQTQTQTDAKVADDE